MSTDSSASSDRRSPDPPTVRPRLTEAAAENVDDIRRTLLEAATSASKPAWSSSSARTLATASESRFPSQTSVPGLPRSSCSYAKDSAAPHRRRNQPPRHNWSRAEAEARALDRDQLKALVVAHPEIEYLRQGKRKQWLVSRWVGLTQPERDRFRAALDAADATRAEHSVASQQLPRSSRAI